MGCRARLGWVVVALAVGLGCGDERGATWAAGRGEGVLVDPAAGYATALERLEGARRALAQTWREARGEARAAVLERARATVWGALKDELIPAWIGTPWAFHGTSRAPGRGTIACGYFVTTVLAQAGFGLDRVKLAQAPSEHIIASLAPAAQTWRFQDQEGAVVVAAMRAGGGDGLYAVGLDHHAALLVLDGERADLCHSSNLGPRAVVCQEAATAAAFVSRYRVVGKLLEADMMAAWLDGAPIATVSRRAGARPVAATEPD